MAQGIRGSSPQCSVVYNGKRCPNTSQSRGWCEPHYRRWQRKGDPLAGGPLGTPRGKPRKNTPESFWARTVTNGACVDWTGRTDRDGYGRVRWQGQVVGAHQLAFFLRLGRWPESHFVMRHLCNRPVCVLHAVEGTAEENTQDAIAAGRHGSVTNARKTHCPKNHPYDEANTRWSKDGRRRTCRACFG